MAITNRDKAELLNHTLKALKTQADRKREVPIKGFAVINPQLLTSSNPGTYGPYYFNTTFAEAPHLSFGAVRLDTRRDPLIVHSNVDKWINSSGGVTGMYVGVYAINSVPSGMRQHKITWNGIGKASTYKAGATTDKWTSANSSSSPDHLIASDGTMEKPG